MCGLTQVPDLKFEVLVLNSFDVETDRWNGRDDFADLQSVENRRFACTVESQDENATFFASEQAREIAEQVAHLCNGKRKRVENISLMSSSTVLLSIKL